jgi:hypothetical protein
MAGAKIAHTSQEQELLDKVPADGGSIGNVSLQRSLSWDAETYWPVRDKLIGEGVLGTGRGKGGSVHRIEAEARTPTWAGGRVVAEKELYEPMLSVIQHDWTKMMGLSDSNFLAWNTAQRGKQQTGKWARPDLTVLARRSFPWYPGNHIEVHTFEVKPPDYFGITAVYEALAQRRRATHAWVLAYLPDYIESVGDEPGDPIVDEVIQEAKRQGIGFIIATKYDDWTAWDIVVEAERREPEPKAVNDFLGREAYMKRERGERIQQLIRN